MKKQESFAFQNIPQKLIVLQKDGTDEQYIYSYKSLLDSDALARAKHALERDKPGENFMEWHLVTTA